MVAMTRRYTLGKRAEQQAETRRKIVEAAVELHTEVGPARTSVSMVAERAGVQRHTFYAHFPNERDLLMACSGLVEERDPTPDAAPWRAIADSTERLETALTDLYAYYERNAQLFASVLRDAEASSLVADIMRTRWGPFMSELHAVLGEGRNEKQRALIHVAVSFFTWRTLTRDSGLSQDAAVEAMTAAVLAA